VSLIAINFSCRTYTASNAFRCVRIFGRAENVPQGGAGLQKPSPTTGFTP